MTELFPILREEFCKVSYSFPFWLDCQCLISLTEISQPPLKDHMFLYLPNWPKSQSLLHIICCVSATLYSFKDLKDSRVCSALEHFGSFPSVAPQSVPNIPGLDLHVTPQLSLSFVSSIWPTSLSPVVLLQLFLLVYFVTFGALIIICNYFFAYLFIAVLPH